MDFHMMEETISNIIHIGFVNVTPPFIIVPRMHYCYFMYLAQAKGSMHFIYHFPYGKFNVNIFSLNVLDEFGT